MKRILLLIFFLILPACVPAAQTEAELDTWGELTPTAVSTTPTANIATILQNRPKSGTPIEFDAFFSGVNAAIFPSPAQLTEGPACPAFMWNHSLTEQPVLPWRYVLNSMSSNDLPETMPWLLAVELEGNNFTTPTLPYYGRFRGHLDDPAFADCQHADRMFVVEKVMAVYTQEPPEQAGWAQVPADFAAWPRHIDNTQAFDVAYPPDWTVEPLAEGAVLGGVIIRSPEQPNYPVIIRVHDGETHLDQYDPASEPPLLKGVGMSAFEQGYLLGEWPETQNLSGFVIDREGNAAEETKAVLFSSNGRTYEIALTYPTGFNMSQDLLNDFTAMVQSFRLHTLPQPSPTPPIKQTLGEGPFIGLEEAEIAARQHSSDSNIDILDAQLMSEADARRHADACSTFSSHPDGVWLITLRGHFEDRTRTVEQYIDAVSGEVLCGEERMPTPIPS